MSTNTGKNGLLPVLARAPHKDRNCDQSTIMSTPDLSKTLTSYWGETPQSNPDSLSIGKLPSESSRGCHPGFLPVLVALKGMPAPKARKPACGIQHATKHCAGLVAVKMTLSKKKKSKWGSAYNHGVKPPGNFMVSTAPL